MNEKILEQIKYCRKEKGMTLKELSEKTGLSVGYLSHLENGERNNPSLDTLIKICNALNMDISLLFTR